MKAPSFALFIFLVFFPPCLQAQQETGSAGRSIPKAEILTARWGAIEHFDYLLERFNAAQLVEELQSMEDIRREILKTMDRELAYFDERFANRKKTKAQANRGKSMRKLTTSFRQLDLKWVLASKPGVNQPSTLFSQFRQHVVEELDDLAKENL